MNVGREVSTYAGIDFTALPRFVPSSFFTFSSTLRRTRGRLRHRRPIDPDVPAREKQRK